jgi:16S rRNA (guanine527-N7)-methyltransferase
MDAGRYRPQDRAALDRGLAQLGLPANSGLVEQLLDFTGLVRKWARSHNLVARGDSDLLISRHVLDSLAIRPHIGAGRLLDVGSGAGFPGIPLAIVEPGLEITVLDSSGKKARFLRHAKRSLGLRNLTVAHARVEEFLPGDPFATIVSRAFSALPDFAAAVRHLATQESRLLAMKGKRPDRELEGLPAWVGVQSVVRIEVPDLRAERHLVIMCVSSETA